MKNKIALLSLSAVCGLLAVPALGQHDPAMHQHHAAMAAPPDAAAAAPAAPADHKPAKDTRQAVRLPAAMKTHTLANMRDHLLALQEIQAALAVQEFERAADIAETRIGMSSLALHGAHEVSKYMPQGMRDAGTAMHRGASRFAVAARDAGATGDLKPVLAALAEFTGACVACHSGYRLP